MIDCTNNPFTDILVDMKCIIPCNVFLLCVALIKQSSSLGIFRVPEVTNAEWVVVKVISLIPGISPGINPGLSNQSFVNSKQYTPEKVGLLGLLMILIIHLYIYKKFTISGFPRTMCICKRFLV